MLIVLEGKYRQRTRNWCRAFWHKTAIFYLIFHLFHSGIAISIKELGNSLLQNVFFFVFVLFMAFFFLLFATIKIEMCKWNLCNSALCAVRCTYVVMYPWQSHKFQFVYIFIWHMTNKRKKKNWFTLKTWEKKKKKIFKSLGFGISSRKNKFFFEIESKLEKKMVVSTVNVLLIWYDVVNFINCACKFQKWFKFSSILSSTIAKNVEHIYDACMIHFIFVCSFFFFCFFVVHSRLAHQNNFFFPLNLTDFFFPNNIMKFNWISKMIRKKKNEKSVLIIHQMNERTNKCMFWNANK